MTKGVRPMDHALVVSAAKGAGAALVTLLALGFVGFSNPATLWRNGYARALVVMGAVVGAYFAL